MHSPAAHALLQPRALLHHPRDTLKDLTFAGHVITITYYVGKEMFTGYLDDQTFIIQGEIPYGKLVRYMQCNFA